MPAGATMGYMGDESWLYRYLDAWNSHDGSKVSAFMDADAVYEDVTLAERHVGPEAIAQFVNNMEVNLSSDYRFEAVSAFSAGEGYYTEWKLLGTHDRDGAGLPASGKQFAIQGVSVGVHDEGKIRHNRDYWNMAEFLVQIGILPPMPAA